MGKRALFFLTMLGLSGCSGPVETRILSSGQGINASISIADTTPAAAAAPLHAKAQELAIAGLQQRVGLSPGAASHQLTVTLSERPAAIALRAGAQQAARVIAAAKRRKPLQNCEDREFRLSIVMTRIADGTESYRGEASEYHCKASIEESLPHLVDAALSDLRSPQGSHLLTRKGRD
jgi:hypothetical protein